MKDFEIRQTIASDFPIVCDRQNDQTVKAFTVVRNGEPVAIAGVTIKDGECIAFSDIKEGVTAPRMTVWKAAKELADRIHGLNLPAYATTAKWKFLASLGCEYIRDIENKKIYRI